MKRNNVKNIFYWASMTKCLGSAIHSEVLYIKETPDVNNDLKKNDNTPVLLKGAWQFVIGN